MRALLTTCLAAAAAMGVAAPADAATRYAVVDAILREQPSRHIAILERPIKATADRLAWQEETVELGQQVDLALDRSYVDTMDCPELCGMRATADILASHKATGEFDPSLW